MRKFWKIAGIATLLAILVAAALGAVAFAQDDGDGYPFDFAQKFREALASALGISVDEYDAAVEKAQDQVVDEALQEGWLTEDQAEMLKWRMDQAPGAPGFGMRGMHKGFGGFERGMMGRGNNLLSVAADQLDLSLTELLTELQGGKSIADVAKEKGVDTQKIVDAYVAQLKEDLVEAVADGNMTQNQADWMLQQAEQRAVDQLDNTWEGGFHGFPGGGRPGGMWGFPGQSGA